MHAFRAGHGAYQLRGTPTGVGVDPPLRISLGVAYRESSTHLFGKVEYGSVQILGLPYALDRHEPARFGFEHKGRGVMVFYHMG
jgi:hypothetical protein